MWAFIIMLNYMTKYHPAVLPLMKACLPIPWTKKAGWNFLSFFLFLNFIPWFWFLPSPFFQTFIHYSGSVLSFIVKTTWTTFATDWLKFLFFVVVLVSWPKQFFMKSPSFELFVIFCWGFCFLLSVFMFTTLAKNNFWKGKFRSWSGFEK